MMAEKSQWKKSASAKNRRGSRKHLLGNIGEKIGKNRQTAGSIKKCKFCTLIGLKFAYRFFPLFADFYRFFPIFPDFFPIFPDFFPMFADFCRCLPMFPDFCRFFAMSDFLKKSRFFRAEKSASRKNRDFSGHRRKIGDFLHYAQESFNNPTK